MIDLIDPIDGLIGRLTRGGGVLIEMSSEGDWAGVDAESLLASYGVSVYGREIGDKIVGFMVNPRQAKWADYLLRRAGAPLLSPNLSGASKGKMPKAWGVEAAPKSFADYVVRGLSKWFGRWDSNFWMRGDS